MNRALFCLIFALSSCALSAQYPGWTNFTYGKEARGVYCDSFYTWVGTGGGLVRVNRATLETEYLTRANFGLPANELGQVAYDSMNNLWVLPLESNAIFRYDGNVWESFICPEAGAFTDFAVRGPNDIWLGSAYAGLYHFDGAAFTQNAWFGGPYAYYQSVQGLSCDSLGRIWFGAAHSIEEQWQYNAIICYDGTQFTLIHPGDYVNYGSKISQTAFDSQNTLWAGTQVDGIWRLDGSAWTHYNTSNSGLSNNYVSALEIDPL